MEGGSILLLIRNGWHIACLIFLKLIILVYFSSWQEKHHGAYKQVEQLKAELHKKNPKLKVGLGSHFIQMSKGNAIVQFLLHENLIWCKDSFRVPDMNFDQKK